MGLIAIFEFKPWLKLPVIDSVCQLKPNTLLVHEAHKILVSFFVVHFDDSLLE